MSRIEELIAALCPDGVEFRELDEICHINRGRVMSKEYLRDNAGQYPVYSSQTANGGVFGYINSYDYDFESITWTTDGANAGSVFYHCDEKFSITNVCGLLKVKDDSLITTKFIYYVLGITTKQHVSSGMGNPKLMSNAMSKIRVPVPPLAVQREIVRVLDTFTALEAELEAELEARRRQYAYYRDRLLAFNGRADIRWATLGEIATFRRGTAITQKGTTDGKIPVVANAPAPIYFHGESNRWGETIVIARSGAYSGLVSFWNQPIFLTDAFSVHPDNKLLKPRFVYYFLQNEQERIHGMKKGSGVPHVRVKDFESFDIPIPPLDEQARIVAILDKFDALVNDLTIGLPAEINGRRQQYAHYRNRLLTFPEKTER